MGSDKLRIKFKKTYWIFFVAFIFVILWILVGINFDFSNEKVQLEQAETLWRQQGIFDYNIVINFVGSDYFGSIELEVEDSQIVTIYDRGNTLQNGENGEVASIPEWEDSYFASQFPATLENYEITNLFEFIDSEISSNPSDSIISLCTSDFQYQISYDIEYGYPNQVLYSNCPNWDFGLGLMCPTTSDCQAGFSIVSFEEK